MAHIPDPRKAINAQRLRRLKTIVLGLSATVTVALWSLVSGAVASNQPSATTTGSSFSQPFVPSDGGGFFGSGQPQTLGGGFSASRPLLRSGGS